MGSVDFLQFLVGTVDFLRFLVKTVDFLTYNSMNSPILFRWWDEWWDEFPPSGIEKNKVFDRERLFDSPGRGIIISAAATIQSKQERC